MISLLGVISLGLEVILFGESFSFFNLLGVAKAPVRVVERNTDNMIFHLRHELKGLTYRQFTVNDIYTLVFEFVYFFMLCYESSFIHITV